MASSSTDNARPLRDPRPLYLQLAEAVLELIRDRGLQAGSTMPSESELMKLFDVGRSTVRETMIYLENEGMVERSQGARSTITSLVRRPSMGLEILEPLEVLAERQGWTCQTHDIDIEQRTAFPITAEKLGIAVGAPITCVSRVKSADDTRFVLMESFVSEHVLSHEDIRTSFDSSITKLIDIRHTLRYAESEIRAIEADEDLASRLSIKSGAPALYMTELFFGDDDKPLCWNVNRIVPDVVRLELLRKLPPSLARTWRDD